MNNQSVHINGYILAGGKSSRMGMDKGLMSFKGIAIAAHILEQLKPAFGKIVIVSDNNEYEKFGVEVIADAIKGIGPAGGIFTALNHSDTALNFIVSCDMPFISTAGIEFILKNAEGAEIILPEHQGKAEPLFGFYAKKVSTRWGELIEQNIVKLQEMIGYFKLNKINVDHNPVFTNLFFTNINTKEDFEAALKLA